MSTATVRLCRRRECFQGAGRAGLCSAHLQDTLNQYSLPELIDMAVELLETRGFAGTGQESAPEPTLN